MNNQPGRDVATSEAAMSQFKEIRDQLNTLLLSRIDELVRYLYPNGHKEGRSWRVGSLDINLKTGMWGDWDGSTKSHSRNLIDLWIYAAQCDFKTALDEIRKWLAIPKTRWNSQTAVREEESEADKKRFVLPLLEKPTASELSKLSSQRSIAIEALQIAVERRFLWTYTARDEGARAWILTDSARKNAVGRRLDGNVWHSIGRKSKTLSGAWGNWPIGIMEAGDYPAIGLAEGAPDFLSVIAHARASGVEHLVAPVCLSGAAMWIPESVLRRFNGKRVRIFIHNDQAGITAANRWSAQLCEAGAIVDGYSFDGLIQSNGRPVEDLNDFCRLDYECLQQHRSAVENVMEFATARDFQDHGR
jgi:hypothetical protein